MNEKQSEVQSVIKCPKCKSRQVKLLSTNRKLFSAAGAGGGLIAYYSKHIVSKGLMLISGSNPAAKLASFLIGGICLGHTLGKFADECANCYKCQSCSHVWEN